MNHEQALILLALTQVGDAATTLAILKRGGRELNPLVRWLMDKATPLTAMVGKGVATVAVGTMLEPVYVLAMAALTAAVVGWNLWQLNQKP
jgi:hypothetical protein